LIGSLGADNASRRRKFGRHGARGCWYKVYVR
jgi:hypothetical protein